MKLLASLIIAVSLALGCYSAAKAYVRNVDTIDAAEGLTLNAPAGRDPETGEPLIAPAPDRDVILDAEVLALLREADVTYVRVKEFRFTRWNLNWLFILSVLGLLAGAVIIRRERARDLAKATQPTAGKAVATPQELLDEAARNVAKLADEIESWRGSADDRLDTIIARIDEIQKNQLMPFVESRSIIIGQFGMAGYAQIMDRFAAAERELNRAWSAAADKVPEESIQCVRTSQSRFEETRAKMKELREGKGMSA